MARRSSLLSLVLMMTFGLVANVAYGADEPVSPPAGLVGEATSLQTWDGKQADLFVPMDQTDDLLASLNANPNLYSGLVIIVEVPQYKGSDFITADLEGD